MDTMAIQPLGLERLQGRMYSDEGGEGLAGGVRLAGGGRAALAAVLPDEGAVFVHTSWKGHACSGRYNNNHARYMC